MRTRKQIVVLAGLATALAAVLFIDELWAQGSTSAGGPIAVIDVVKVFNEFRQTQDLNEEFDKRRRQVQEELDARDVTLETKAGELEAFHPDSADYNKRRRELLRLRIDRENYMRFAEIEVRELFRDWTKRTYEQICQTAAEVARERGFEVVLAREELEEGLPDAAALKQQIRSRKVIFFNQESDITDQVLDRLNRSYEQKAKRPELAPLTP
ncbi:MAG: OmpH family outer membrane protein [Phycisphaerales bacterium]|nr:MAG: OmpH family outer membrane protein [Phycisphaerales bacterium]